MKRKYKYKTYNFFVLRTPLLPIAVGKELLNLKTSKEIQEKIKNILKDDFFLKALDSINPDLLHSKHRNMEGREYLSFYNYISRCSFRSTSLGMLTTASLGTSAEKTVISSAAPYSDITIHTATLISPNDVLILANPTLTKLNDNYFYLNWKSHIHYNTHSYSSIEPNSLLKSFLKFTEKQKTEKQVLNFLKINGLSSLDAKSYLKEILEKKIVISNSDLRDLTSLIEWSQSSASSFEKKELKSHNKLINFSATRKFEALTLSKADFELPVAALDLLYRCFEVPSIDNSVEAILGHFKKHFLQRYSDHEVPLLIATSEVYGNTIQSMNEVSKITENFASEYEKDLKAFYDAKLDSLTSEYWELSNQDIVSLENLSQRHLYRLPNFYRKKISFGTNTIGNYYLDQNQKILYHFRFSNNGSSLGLLNRYLKPLEISEKTIEEIISNEQPQ